MLIPHLFLRQKAPCWVGVQMESESESIFSVRSRSWSRSRLKFVDFAALVRDAKTDFKAIYYPQIFFELDKSDKIFEISAPNCLRKTGTAKL